MEFSIVDGAKGREAVNVAGPEREPVQDNPHAADRPPFHRHGFPRELNSVPWSTADEVSRTMTAETRRRVNGRNLPTLGIFSYAFTTTLSKAWAEVP